MAQPQSKRKPAVKQQAKQVEPGISISIDDTEYVIRMSDMTGLDAKDFRAQVGMTLTSVFFGQVPQDIDTLAGLIWLARRRTEPGLTYRQVAGSINLTTVMDVGTTEANPPEA